jgi:hypothetical protein
MVGVSSPNSGFVVRRNFPHRDVRLLFQCCVLKIVTRIKLEKNKILANFGKLFDLIVSCFQREHGFELINIRVRSDVVCTAVL